MRFSAARPVMCLRVPRLAILPSAARPVMRRRVAQPSVRPSAARSRTSAPQSTGWTWPWKRQPEAPAPADPTMVLALLVSSLTIIGAQKVFIDDSNTVLTIKLDTISKDVAANTASIKEFKSEINTKLDALSANLQAQQIQTADLKGQVTILRERGQKQ